MPEERNAWRMQEMSSDKTIGVCHLNPKCFLFPNFPNFPTVYAKETLNYHHSLIYPINLTSLDRVHVRGRRKSPSWKPFSAFSSVWERLRFFIAFKTEMTLFPPSVHGAENFPRSSLCFLIPLALNNQALLEREHRAPPSTHCFQSFS